MSASRSFPAFLQLNLIEPQAAEHRHDEKGPIEGLTGRAEQHLKALKDSLPGQVMSSRQNSPNAPLCTALGMCSMIPRPQWRPCGSSPEGGCLRAMR